MENCIFCKIVSGDLPSYKVYEDKDFLAFLDIYPHGPGHTLIIPKIHSRWLWDMESVAPLYAVVHKLANHYKKILDVPTCFSYVLGEEVPHTHIHLVPATPEAKQNLLSRFMPDKKTQLDDIHAQEFVTKLKLT